VSELPGSWITAALHEIVPDPQQDIVDGPFGSNLKANEYQDSGVPIIRLQNVARNHFLEKNIKFITHDKADELQRHNFLSGDIAITKLGDPLGKAAIIPPSLSRGVIVADIVRLRVHEEYADPRYLTYAINSPDVCEALAEKTKGTTRPRVNLGHIRSLQIPVAPLNEQKRIADKLDAVLSRVDACRERLDRVPAILKRFRQAVLAAATSAALTEEWREDLHRSLQSWATKTGREVFPFITSGSRGWASYYSESGARFLRVGNLNHDTIELDLQDVQHVAPPPGAEGQRTRIKVGDILISITADIGMVGLVRKDLGESYINQHICLARQTGEYSGPYLAYFLASPIGGLAQLTEVQRGATKAGLTLEDIREVQIQAPLRDEQDEIVRRVEVLFAYADRLEARYTAARAQFERLTPTLLAKAFRGELVPQDPNDEPASVLLERIRAARATSEGATVPKRRKGGGRPKTSQKAGGLMLTRKDIQDAHLTTILKERGPLTAEALWSASQLDIDDFYDQLKDEETRGLLREKRGDSSNAPRTLEAT
jgi:type I restriction enzyme S subunit